jgi:hypothetical protein
MIKFILMSLSIIIIIIIKVIIILIRINKINDKIYSDHYYDVE